jgi:hypothetical protein
LLSFADLGGVEDIRRNGALLQTFEERNKVACF